MDPARLLANRRTLKHKVIKTLAFASFLALVLFLFGDLSQEQPRKSNFRTFSSAESSWVADQANIAGNVAEIESSHHIPNTSSPSTDDLQFSLLSSSKFQSNRNIKGSTVQCSDPGQYGSQQAICAYIASNCPLQGGYIDYLNLFYCSQWLGSNRSLGYFSLAAWLLFLFFALGFISNEYFVPTLTSISYTFSIPAEIAGLTLLAFANGASNVASYFAAVTNNSFDFAIGDVFGGSLYVLCIVGSSVCIAGKKIALNGYSFMRDLLFLIGGVTANFIFVWTGRYYVYESIGLLVYYVAFVGWASVHDLMSQRKKRLEAKRKALEEGTPLPKKRSYKSQSSVFKQAGLRNIIEKIDQELDAKERLSQPPFSVHSEPETSDGEKKDSVRKEIPKHISFNVNLNSFEETEKKQTDLGDAPTELEENKPNAKPKAQFSGISARTLRRAFALGTTAQAVLGATTSAELDASVEDILAPPLEGASPDDNAVHDGTLPIPNVHIYQESMEEELLETQSKGAYVWTLRHWIKNFSELSIFGKIFYFFTWPMNVPLFFDSSCAKMESGCRDRLFCSGLARHFCCGWPARCNCWSL